MQWASPSVARAWLLAALLALPHVAAGQQAAAQALDDAATLDVNEPESAIEPTVAVPVDGAYSEDQVKAAFLFHFATYAEWPMGDLDGELTFAVLRAPNIATQLERFAQGRNIQGRPVRVRQIYSMAQLRSAEVLFIGASQNRRLPQLIEAVEGPTLVVTDSQDGLPDGAMINFQLVDQRVRFEIALAAAQRVGLSLSSRLLSAAMRVEMSRCYLECRRHDGVLPEYGVARWVPALRIPRRA